MALPIFAYYMQKVYADERLGYSQDEKFDFPEGFDPCVAPEDVLENENEEQSEDEPAEEGRIFE